MVADATHDKHGPAETEYMRFGQLIYSELVKASLIYSSAFQNYE
jgi:hypothetical protein